MLVKRTNKLVTAFVQGRYTWKFPADYDYFELSYNDLTHVLETEGFEPVFGSANGNKVALVNVTGGTIGER